MDFAVEVQDVLRNLSGNRESMKGIKSWFMQRALFVSALPQVLKERVFAFKDSQGQLHIIFLVNRAVPANPDNGLDSTGLVITDNYSKNDI